MLVINSIGISILALFLLAVVQKKQKSVVDYSLMVVIGLFAALLWSHVWISLGLTSFRFVFQNLSHTYLFPSYVLYALLLLDREHRIRKEWWWIGSFAVAFTVFSVLDVTVLNQYTEEELYYVYEVGPPIYQVFYKGGFLFDIIALSWLLQRIRRYRHDIKDYYSSIDSIQLNWLYTFTIILILTNAAAMSTFLMYNFGWLQEVETTFSIVFGIISASLFYFCYHGVRQYNLAEFNELKGDPGSSTGDATATSPKTAKPKYKTSSLKDEEMDKIYHQINRCLVEEKIYCDPDLKVYHLAQRLGVTTHNISQTINSKAQKPFYDLVNAHRVDHLKQLLTAPDKQQFTILGLGLESGFNSKTSLNRIFKQHTGMSPSTFRRMQMVSA